MSGIVAGYLYYAWIRVMALITLPTHNPYLYAVPYDKCAVSLEGPPVRLKELTVGEDQSMPRNPDLGGLRQAADSLNIPESTSVCRNTP